MTSRKRRLLRSVATKSVIAVLPIAMASAYAGLSYVPTPPRLAAYDYLPVAEITATSTTVGLADSSLYFLTDPTLTIDPAQVAKHLDEMQALGVDNIRVYVPWKYVESTQGQYDWSSMDVILNLAAERNMGVLAAINTTPQWVDPNDEYSPGAAQPKPEDFTAFVSAFATRYGSTVSAYEIWNEPNYIQFYDPVDPAAYTELLKSVYPALKAIDPTATIVAAGLGHSSTSGDVAMSPVEFVQGMYAAGAKGYFDALAYHPYQETTPFSQGTPDGYALNQALAMVALMASNGDYVTGPDGQALLDANGQPITKKIWATEYGLATSRVTYEHQAAYIQDFLNTWATQTWAGPAYVYTTVDSDPTSDDPEKNFGVYTVDAKGNWVKKPAAQVLADWILAHPNQTFEPTGPTNPTGPGNPLQALAAFVHQFVQQFIQISQAFIGVIVQAITHFIGSFAGPAVTNAAPLTLRVASAQTPAETDSADLPEAKAAAPAIAKVADHVAELAAPVHEKTETTKTGSAVDAVVAAPATEAAGTEAAGTADAAPAASETSTPENPKPTPKKSRTEDGDSDSKVTGAKHVDAKDADDRTNHTGSRGKPKHDNASDTDPKPAAGHGDTTGGGSANAGPARSDGSGSAE